MVYYRRNILYVVKAMKEERHLANAGLAILWVFLSLLMAGLAYAVHNKKQYGLLNGVSSYSEEEMKEAEENGYFSFTGRYLWAMAIIFALTFPLLIFNVPYGGEIFTFVLLTGTLGGALWGIRKGIKRTRKRDTIIMAIVSLVTVGGVGYLFYSGNQETTVQIGDSQIVIEDMYEDEITYADITDLSLVDDLPENMIKSNGFATETRLLGSFRSKEHGPVRAHVFRDYPPYIAIKTDGKFYLFNSKDANETKDWYELIKEKNARN